MAKSITFFVDFDNTLIDNDKVKTRIRSIMSKKYGQQFTDRFLAINQQLREEKGYVDFPGTIEQIAKEEKGPELVDKLHDLFHNFNFQDCLFSKTAEVIKYLGNFGRAVIVTEGDSHYQKIKIKNSGIWDLVGGKVEIPLKDKVAHLAQFIKKYSSDIYYFIEDKPEVLKEVHDLYKGEIKTIHVCQGHYSQICQLGLFDITVKYLAELLNIKF